MLVLVCYDVNVTSIDGRKRLRHIAKHCLDYGVRVQNSIFECEIDPAQLVQLKSSLLDSYDEELDSLRFYFLGKKGRQKFEHYGCKKVVDHLRDALII